MSADPACRAPVPPEGAVPRTCVPFAHVPAVPAVMVPYVPVPVPSGLPVLSVAGIVPDRTGNVDVTRFLEGWAAGPLAGKADKAAPLAAGSLAALDAGGNLADSGKSPSDFAPASGIAKTALDASVQASLGRADTAVQPGHLLDGDRIKSSLLPSFVDDVLEYSASSGFPESGETGKIYVAKDTNKTYRWSGSQYVEIAASPVTSVNGQTGAVVLDIPAAQVNADWNAASGAAQILNKPTIPAAVAVDQTLATRGAAADAKSVGDALAGKRGMDDLSYAAGDWFVTGAAEMRLVRDSSVAPPSVQWTATVDGERWVLAYTGPFWRFGIPGAADAEDEVSGADATSLTFDIDGSVYNLAKGRSLALTTDIPALPYAIVSKTPVSGTVSLSDRSVNVVQVSSDVEFALPPAVPGRSRDFYLRLLVTGSKWSDVTLSPSSGVTYTGWGTVAQRYTPSADPRVFRFTETAANEFHVENVLTGNPIPAQRVTSGTLDAARIPSLAASKITSGTFSSSRIPSLDASKIKSGTFPPAMLPVATVSARGAVRPDNVTIGVYGDVGDHEEGQLYVKPEVLSFSSYALVSNSPVSGTVTLSDRAVNLVSPTVTTGTPAWTWSDGLAHGTPAYLYDAGYGGHMWGFDDGNGGHSYYDALGNYLEWNWMGDGDSEEVSFGYYDEDEGDYVTVTATLETPYVSDVTALALPGQVSGKSRDFMVRLAMPEHAAMFSWPSGVVFETEDGKFPDVSEPGVYLLAFTETGADRFALLCRKVQGVS